VRYELEKLARAIMPHAARGLWRMIDLVIGDEQDHRFWLNRRHRAPTSMPLRQDTDRCWLCANATWFLPVWTWTVVCITGLLVVGPMRPPTITAWLMLMGVVMFPIAVCIFVMMDEDSRDRVRDAQNVDGASPRPDGVRPARSSR
jgi:hypothetical protein